MRKQITLPHQYYLVLTNLALLFEDLPFNLCKVINNSFK